MTDHFTNGTCPCPLDGNCCECGKACSDHDLVGNQVELGFPVYWCNECIGKHLDEDENERKRRN
jgi:hypothetical protein